MRLSGRGKQTLQIPELQAPFLQELEQGLVQEPSYNLTGIDEFERVYQKKKMLNETIQEYQSKNNFFKKDILRAKQRIYQISQLNQKANKQSVMMKNQINKINEAHTMSKILMMQKILRIGLDNQNMQKKRAQCQKVRQQKRRLSFLNSSNQLRIQRNRQKSLLQTKALRQYINDRNYQTIEEKRTIADRVRSEKERRKQRLIRYEEFKLSIAKKNYESKTVAVRKALQQNQRLLENLYKQQLKQERHYQTTQNVTKQYLNSLFPTQTL